MGQWLAVNGEAIYATQPTLFGAEAGAFSPTEKDKNGKSSCSGMCAGFWPPLLASGGKPRAAGSAKASLLGTTKRADGHLQVTYNHHPLYTFKKDTQKGQTNGEELSAFGAKWYAVSPAGAKVKSGGGGGY